MIVRSSNIKDYISDVYPALELIEDRKAEYQGLDALSLACDNAWSGGLIIEKNFQSGLLLPQVPVEYNWSVVDFLNHTCHKAGLPNGSWKDKDTKISKFQGIIFREILPNGEIIREKFQ